MREKEESDGGEQQSLDCKTVVFFANAGDRQYANERWSGASVKTTGENAERR